MAVTKQQTESIIKKFQTGNLDTGSSQVQIALLTAKINELSSHFTTHKKDKHGVRGLMTAVNRRRKLLDYLHRTNKPAYEKILKDLDIRK